MTTTACAATICAPTISAATTATVSAVTVRLWTVALGTEVTEFAFEFSVEGIFEADLNDVGVARRCWSIVALFALTTGRTLAARRIVRGAGVGGARV